MVPSVKLIDGVCGTIELRRQRTGITDFQPMKNARKSKPRLIGKFKPSKITVETVPLWPSALRASGVNPMRPPRTGSVNLVQVNARCDRSYCGVTVLSNHAELIPLKRDFECALLRIRSNDIEFATVGFDKICKKHIQKVP